MKITVVTIRVVGNPLYDGNTERWIRTYKEFTPTIPHEVVVVNCDHDKPDGAFDDIANRYILYTGGGWDCGAWIHVGRHIDTDFLVCCNTSTYFTRHGWLQRFVESAEKYGTGLYGSMASFEHAPHLRTPCMAFQPEVIRAYPHSINCRQKTYFFECLGRRQNFSLWCIDQGRAVKLVTWDGEYDIADWRKPPNIFRRGDQSNVIVKDKHCDAYAASDEPNKAKLAKMADGI